MTLRKTKIVATLGPASSTEEVLDRMVAAGVDVVRLNFSHGSAQEHIQRAELIREIARRRRRPVGVLCDLQGPKIRIGRFPGVSFGIAEHRARVGLTERLAGDASRQQLFHFCA